MPRCCVPFCKNNSTTKGVSMYRFPADDVRRKKWIDAIRREKFTPTYKSRICSWHFSVSKENGPDRFAWSEMTSIQSNLCVLASVAATLEQQTADSYMVVGDNTAAADHALDCKAFDSLQTHPDQDVSVDGLQTQPHNEASLPVDMEDFVNFAPQTADSCIVIGDNSAAADHVSDYMAFDSLQTHPDQNVSVDGLQTQPHQYVVCKTRLPVDMEDSVNNAPLRHQNFSFADIKHNDALIRHYTGIPDNSTFMILCNMLKRFDIQYVDDWNVELLSLEDQLLLTLIKLRLNFPHFDLAFRFGISTGTVSNIFRTIVLVLYQVLWDGVMKDRMPSRQKCQLNVSDASFPNCRLIIDCTEVAIAVPSDLESHCSVYSNYKGKATFKALVACAPNGILVYASDLYGGSLHDKAITQDCGLLDHLEAGDALLADKGFVISDVLPAGVTVNTPAFLHNGQFSTAEIITNKKIASARIHIERAIQRIKLYKILDIIPYQYRKLSSKLFKVCVALTTLQAPTISKLNIITSNEP